MFKKIIQPLSDFNFRSQKQPLVLIALFWKDIKNTFLYKLRLKWKCNQKCEILNKF